MKGTMQTTTYSNTSVDEMALVIQAREGETIGLVEYIYCERLKAMAWRLVRMFQDTCGAQLDVEDVTQVGIEYVLRSLRKALELETRTPIGYLLWVAKRKMLDYCKEQHCPIRVPAASQYQLGKRVPWVDSLDAPLVAGGEETLADVLAAGEVWA
jgi:DNA-directed RNA polymerase specialized sigma24 family protein